MKYTDTNINIVKKKIALHINTTSVILGTCRTKYNPKIKAELKCDMCQSHQIQVRQAPVALNTTTKQKFCLRATGKCKCDRSCVKSDRSIVHKQPQHCT